MGAWMGQALGDALGSTHEFTPPHHDPADPIEMVGGGPFNWRVGEYTDDTQMAVGIANMYVTEKRYHQGTLIANWRAWLRSGPKDVGGWTRSSLAAWSTTKTSLRLTPCYDITNANYIANSHPAFNLWLDRGANDAANGGTMRCVPTLLATPDRKTRIAEAKAICEDTHPDPRTWGAVIFMIEFADLLANGKDRFDAFYEAIGIATREMRRSRCPHHYIATLMTALLRAPDLAWSKWDNGGYVVPAIQVAAAATLQATSAVAGLTAVIRRGGDSDTVGAMAGVLLGARFGIAGWPANWVDKLHDKAYPGLGEKLLSLRSDRLSVSRLQKRRLTLY